MLGVVLYFTVILIELIFAVAFSVVCASFLYSSLKGSPYVPTRKKELEKILSGADLKAGQLFYELGSGDGRLSRFAAANYKVKAVGVDVNPILIWLARFLTRINKVKNVEFVQRNIFDLDLRNANVLYLFLMPQLISRLVPKLENELRKGTLVISHGFTIVEWKKSLVKKIEGKPFSTFYYRKS